MNVKEDYGVEDRVIYKAVKPFWRVRRNVEISLVLHGKLKIIEVICVDTASLAEAARVYFNMEVLKHRIDHLEVSEMLALRKEDLLRSHQRVRLSELTKETTLEAMVLFIIARLDIVNHAEASADSRYVSYVSSPSNTPTATSTAAAAISIAATTAANAATVAGFDNVSADTKSNVIQNAAISSDEVKVTVATLFETIQEQQHEQEQLNKSDIASNRSVLSIKSNISNGSGNNSNSNSSTGSPVPVLRLISQTRHSAGSLTAFAAVFTPATEKERDSQMISCSQFKDLDNSDDEDDDLDTVAATVTSAITAATINTAATVATAAAITAVGGRVLDSIMLEVPADLVPFSSCNNSDQQQQQTSVSAVGERGDTAAAMVKQQQQQHQQQQQKAHKALHLAQLAVCSANGFQRMLHEKKCIDHDRNRIRQRWKLLLRNLVLRHDITKARKRVLESPLVGDWYVATIDYRNSMKRSNGSSKQTFVMFCRRRRMTFDNSQFDGLVHCYAAATSSDKSTRRDRSNSNSSGSRIEQQQQSRNNSKHGNFHFATNSSLPLPPPPQQQQQRHQRRSQSRSGSQRDRAATLDNGISNNSFMSNSNSNSNKINNSNSVHSTDSTDEKHLLPSLSAPSDSSPSQLTASARHRQSQKRVQLSAAETAAADCKTSRTAPFGISKQQQQQQQQHDHHHHRSDLVELGKKLRMESTHSKYLLDRKPVKETSFFVEENHHVRTLDPIEFALKHSATGAAVAATETTGSMLRPLLVPTAAIVTTAGTTPRLSNNNSSNGGSNGSTVVVTPPRMSTHQLEPIALSKSNSPLQQQVHSLPPPSLLSDFKRSVCVLEQNLAVESVAHANSTWHSHAHPHMH